MAAITNCRRAFEHDPGRTGYVTLGAGKSLVSAGQRKRRFGMIERDRQPSVDRMAYRAILAQGSFVDIVFGVAAGTDHRRSFEDIVNMASGAFNGQVFARQREGGQGMVDRGLLPIIGHVAPGAFLPEVALVGVVFRMAGVTVGRRSFEHLVLMAGGAIDGLVLAGQREFRQVVVDLRPLLPTRRVVALGAVLAKVTLVHVVFGVAGITGPVERFHIRNRTRSVVALAAGQGLVFSAEGKRKPRMIKCASIRVDAIVTGPAVQAIRRYMVRHKGRIQILMAGSANCLVEFDKTVGVAIGAGERGSRRHFLMGFERVTGGVMRKRRQIPGNQ